MFFVFRGTDYLENIPLKIVQSNQDSLQCNKLQGDEHLAQKAEKQ